MYNIIYIDSKLLRSPYCHRVFLIYEFLLLNLINYLLNKDLTKRISLYVIILRRRGYDMSFQQFSRYLLALKSESKIKNFFTEKKILINFIPASKSFTFSAVVYSEDSYIPKILKDYVNDFYSREGYSLTVDPRKGNIILTLDISAEDRSSSPRENLIEFFEKASQTIRSLDQLASNELCKKLF